MTDLVRLGALVVLLCSGCGQTGPLYLPGETRPTSTSTATLPSATENGDEEEDEDAR